MSFSSVILVNVLKIAALLLLWAPRPVNSSRYHVVGHENEDQFIQLKSQFDVLPGKVLSLPIDVPDEFLGIFGEMIPRLYQVNATSPDFVYGAGDEIFITLDFTDDVEVVGNPFITVNTGCFDESCVTKEVQTFTCTADYGKFAMQMQDQIIMNVDVNTTQDGFKYLLERFEGINEVTVKYSVEDDREYSEGPRICSTIGNIVTITYEDVTFPELEGDVPEITLDKLNELTFSRTGLTAGDGVILTGITDALTPSITSPTTEVTKGNRKSVGRADYYDGSGTNSIRFKYTVRGGDYTDDLEVTGLYFSNGYIFSQGANVSTIVPEAGSSGRYMSNEPLSLSFHRDIGVSTEAPTVILVTSPDANAVYTQGDTITIHLSFDLPVKVYNGHLLYLALSAGNFARRANYIRQVTPYMLEFKYAVEAGDFSASLEYTNIYGFVVLPGGLIYRDTVANSTLADVLLPTPKSVGSLSYEKTIVINTAAPIVTTVTYNIDAAPIPGSGTAGDYIELITEYDFAVHVGGQPRIWLANNITDLNTQIRTAPANPVFSYRRAKPFGIAQVVVAVVVNFRVESGDKINVDLPGFRLGQSSGLTSLTLTTETAVNFDGVWDPALSRLVLTSKKTVPSGTEVRAVILANSGLQLPSKGIVGSIDAPTIGIDSALATLPNGPFTAPWHSGLSSFALTLTSNMTASRPASIVLSFTVPEPISVGDVYFLRFNGFTPGSGVPVLYSAPFSASHPEIQLSWNSTTNVMKLNFTSQTSLQAYSLPLTDVVELITPAGGVGPDSVKLSMNTHYNGDVHDVDVPFITPVCALLGTDVTYDENVTGAATGVKLSFTVSPMDLVEGDSVTFTLSKASTLTTWTDVGYTATSSSRNWAATNFTVQVKNKQIKMTVNTPVLESAIAVEVSLTEAAGFVVPNSGVSASTRYFTRINSAKCNQDMDQVFYMSKYVIPVSAASVTFSDTVVPADTSSISTITLTFTVPGSLSVNDTISLELPDFYRDRAWGPNDNTVSLTVTPSGGSASSVSIRDSAFYYGTDTLLVEVYSSPVDTDVDCVYTMVIGSPYGLVVPLNGIQTDSLYMAIESATRGTAARQRISNNCLGFCSGSAAYSNYVYNSTVVIEYTAKMSHSMANNQAMTISFPGFNSTNPPGGHTVTIQVSGGSELSVTSPTWTAVSQELSFNLPTAVGADTDFTISVEGLKYSDRTGITFTPSVMSVNGATARPSGALTLDYAYPTVYQDMLCSDASVTWNTDGTEASFTCTPGVTLDSGAKFLVYLPSFGLSGTLTFTGVTAMTLDVDNCGLTNSATGEVTFALSTGVTSGTQFVVKVAGIVPQDDGFRAVVDPAVDSTDMSYNFVREDGIVGLSKLFDTIASLDFLYDTRFTYEATSVWNLTELSFILTTSRDIEAGDKFIINAPFLSGNGTNAVTTYTMAGLKDGSDASAFTSVTWVEAQKDITLVVASNLANKTLHFTVYPVNSGDGLNMPDYGVPNGVTLTLSHEDVSASVTISKTLTVPCFGVCSASLTPAIQNAGYATEMQLDMTFGKTVRFEADSHDSISVALPGFDGTYLASLAADDRTMDGFLFAWDATSSELALGVVDSAVYSKWNPLSVEIPRQFILKAPSAGVPGSTTYTAKFSSVSTGYMDSITVDMGAIGKVLSANFSVSPISPNVAVDVEFDLLLEESLVAGSVIHVTLPEHSVPGRNIAFTETISNTPSLFSVMGVAEVTTTNTNAIGGTYVVESPPSIRITCLSDIPTVAAGTKLNFRFPKSANIRLPLNGVGVDQMPYLSIVSTSSPVSMYEISNFDFVGSMYPSRVEVTTGNASVDAIGVVRTTFVVTCALESGAKINAILPSVTGDDVAHGGMPVVVSSGQTGTTATASWSNSTQKLELNITNTGAMVLGTYSFDIDVALGGLNFSSQLVYDNDPRYTYEVVSAVCPVEPSAFDTSSGSGLKSSVISFGNPVAGQVSVVNLQATTAHRMRRHDEIMFTLADFNVSMARHADQVWTWWWGWGWTAPLTGLSASLFGDYAYVRLNGSNLELNMTLRTTVPVGSLLSVSLPESFGIILPDDGVFSDSHGITIDVKRKLTYDHIANDSTTQTGLLQTVQTVGKATSTAVLLDTPLVSTPTAITFNFTLTGEVLYGETVKFSLPGFTRADGAVTLSYPVGARAMEYYSAAWDGSAEEITFTAIEDVPKGYAIGLYVDVSEAFVAPSYGIADTSTVYTISTNAISGVVLPVQVETVTVVPTLTSSSIALYSSEDDEVYTSDGNYNSIQLYPNNGLSVEDVGSQVYIGANFYTITSYADDFIGIKETYQESTVLAGSPQVKLYTPEIRPAFYHSGSGSSSLVFRYPIKRSDRIGVLAAATPSASNYLTSAFDVSEGSVNRLAARVLINASLVLPTFSYSPIIVNTDTPTIVNVTTTTRSGYYSNGDQIDFQVHFSAPVIVQKNNVSSPVLLIRLDGGSGAGPTSKAYYTSGSTTNILVFVYTVKGTDDYIDRGRLLLRPMIEPLRVLMNNEFNYIRRWAVEPYLDADVDVSAAIAYGFARNISFVANATSVSKISANTTVRLDYAFTAGDVLQVFVEFDSPVWLLYGPSGEPPTISLNTNLATGRSGLATYRKIHEGNLTMEFVYTVHKDDSLANGLYLTCGCMDYFNRTFIELGDAELKSVYGGGRGEPPSVVLAADNTDSARLISAGVTIDNTVPQVTLIYSNLTAGTYPPGTAIKVSVVYDTPVLVLGFVRIRLRGETSSCLARYHDGNQTSTLEFLYLTSRESATSQLDCMSTAALDTQLGTVYRDSEAASVVASPFVMAPGAFNSLGMQTDVTIDTTRATVVRVLRAGADAQTQNRPLLSMDGFMLLQRNGSDLELYSRYYLEDDVVKITTEKELSKVDEILEANLDHSLRVVQLYDSDQYKAYHVSDAMLRPITYGVQFARIRNGLPVDVSMAQWWKAYTTTSVMDVRVVYDRDVDSNNAAQLTLNTGDLLNKAASVQSSATWFIDVNIEGLPSDLAQAQFQIALGGYLTRCLTITATSQGPNSIQEGIDEIPSFANLGAVVSVVQNTVKKRQYQILLQRPADDPIEVVSTTNCETPMMLSRLRVHKGRDLTFRYNVRHQPALAFIANDTVLPGTYTFNVAKDQGVSLSRWGISPGSMTLEHFDDTEARVSRQLVTSMKAFPGILWSSLGFSATETGTATKVSVAVCIDGFISEDDFMEVKLPGFSNTSGTFNYNYRSTYMRWEAEMETLRLTKRNSEYNSSCFADTIPISKGIVLPQTAIYENTEAFTYSLVTRVQGSLQNATFEQVSPVGLASIRLDVGDPRPGYETSLTWTFTLMNRIEANKHSFLFYLPEFSRDDDKPLKLAGDFAHAFMPFWEDSTLRLLARLDLLPGEYFVELTKDSGATVGSRGFYQQHPTVAIRAENTSNSIWTGIEINTTVLQHFPPIVSVERSSLMLDISQPSGRVTKLNFTAEFPMELTNKFSVDIYVPSLIHDTGYQKWQVASIDGTVEWFEEERIFRMKSPSGLSSGREVAVVLTSLTVFNIRDEGIPEGEHGVTLSFAGAEGTLTNYPVGTVTVVPMITMSKVRFSPDIFSSEFNSNITITASFNTMLLDGDLLDFKLYSVVGADVSDSNVLIEGACASVIGRRWWQTNSTLRIPVSIGTIDCPDPVSSISWKVLNYTGLSSPQNVSQYGSDVFAMNWENTYLNTELTPLTDPPLVGFLSSAVAFSNPSAGQLSDVNFKFITSTATLVGDIIELQLPDFAFSWVTLSLTDTSLKPWTAVWDSATFTLKLKSYTDLPPTKIEISIEGNDGATLPVAGVDVAETDPSRQILVTLLRGDFAVGSQVVGGLSAVGYLSNTDATITPHPRRPYDNITHHVINSAEVEASFDLSAPLQIGDELRIKIPSYEFVYDSPLVLGAYSTQGVSARADARDSSIVISTTQVISGSISILIKPSTAIQRSGSICATDGACPIYVSSSSKSLPLKDFSMQPKCDYRASLASVAFDSMQGTVDPFLLWSGTNYVPNTFETVVDLQIKMQTLLHANMEIRVKIPYLTAAGNVGLYSLQNLTNEVHGWDYLWDQASRTLIAVTNQSLSNIDDTLRMTLGTNDLSFENKVIYRNDPTITYAFVNSALGCNVDGGSFDIVHPQGLAASKLTLSNPRANETTDLHLIVTPAVRFEVGDIVRVKLPGFNITQDGDRRNVTLIEKSGQVYTGYWRDYNSTLLIKVGRTLDYSEPLDLTVKGTQYDWNFDLKTKHNVSRIFTPDLGSNREYGLPSVAIAWRTNLQALRVLTAPLSFYEPFVAVVSSGLTFSTPIAGLASDFVFSVTASTPLQVGDTLEFYLPNCFSTSPDLTVNDGYSVVWRPCEETLYVTIDTDLPSGTASITVTGLRIPSLGITGKDVSYFVLSGMTSYGKLPAYKFQSVQYVGRFLHSKLQIEGPSWNVDDDDMKLLFEVSLAGDLAVGDEIYLRVPGLTITTSTNVVNVGGVLQSSSLLTATYNSGTETITLTAVSDAPAGTFFALTLTTPAAPDGMRVPTDGFPGANVVDIKTNAITGPIDWIPIDELSPVGIPLAKVTYDIDDLLDAVGIRFSFQPSDAMVMGDNVSFVCPSLIHKEGITNVTNYGDTASDKFNSFFDVSYEAGPQRFTITARKSIVAREYNVFVPRTAGFYLNSSSGTDGVDHTVSGWIASLGLPSGQNIAERVIEHSPDNIKAMAATDVELSGCFAGTACEFSMSLTLNRLVTKGEIVTIAHPNLVVDEAVIAGAGVGPVTLAVSGTASPKFYGQFRPADRNPDVSIATDDILLTGNGFVRAAADITYDDASLVLSSTKIGVRVESLVPRVLSYYAETPKTPITMGDSILIKLTFSEAVTVSSRDLNLLLSNGGSAKYLRGNNTAEFVMRYYIDDPQDTSDLAVSGPGALEFHSSAVVTRQSDAMVRANMTLAGPYDSLSRARGSFAPISMQSNGTASIQSVAVSSKAGTYSGGDTLDLQVRFNRDVVVQGTPTLYLKSVLAHSTTTMAASFVNVSKSQILEIENGGQFKVEYDGAKTSCIDFGDEDTLMQQLRALSSLQSALPVTSVSSVTAGGRRYSLTFEGAAPSILSIVTVECPQIGTGRVQYPTTMFSSVIFRYIIEAGDSTNSTALQLNNTASLTLGEFDKIYVRGPLLVSEADLTLTDAQTTVASTDGSLVTIDTDAPYVVTLNATYYAPYGQPASQVFVQTGDYIDVDVVFSYPLAVDGLPYLMLALDSYYEGKELEQTIFHRTAVFNKLVGNTITFRYETRQGDAANRLDVVSEYALRLNGSKIYANTDVKTVVAIPNIFVNQTVGGVHYNQTALAARNVTISAMKAPRISRILTNHAAGSYGVGEVISIILRFYAPVTVVPLLEDVVPHVLLDSPEKGIMYYVSGSGTMDLEFQYRVRLRDGLGTPLSFGSPFEIDVIGANLTDALGNVWHKNRDKPDTSQLDAIYINVAPPTVVSVYSSSADGVYHPGMSVDLTIRFDKAVVVIPSAKGSAEITPQVAVDNVYLKETSRLSTFKSGNATKELVFSFCVPVMDDGHAKRPRTRFDYAGVAALSSHMRGAFIRRSSTFPSVEADLKLPDLEDSSIRTDSDIILDLAIPHVEEVRSVTPNGIYSTGDTIRIAVKYSQPVMVFTPPVLRMEVGDGDQDAVYVGGNYTDTLLFDYTVEKGDNSPSLNYVDTRTDPYRLKAYQYSLALYTDLRPTSTGRIPGNSEYGNLVGERRDDVTLYRDRMTGGGVYRASECSLVVAKSHLPLPGEPGSLSDTSSVVIDTEPTTVLRVYTTLPNGAYGLSSRIPIYVQFSSPVVISGCPYIIFYISGVDRRADYVSGDGTAELKFELLVSVQDEAIKLDYRDSSALYVGACSDAEAQAQKQNPGAFYIKRKSMNSLQLVDRRLPEVENLATVTSPRSLWFSGHDITLSGGEVAPRVVWADVEPRALGVGDALDVQVTFGGPVEVVGKPIFRLRGMDRVLPYQQNYNESTLSFRLVVQPSDNVSALTYDDEFALTASTSCDIKDTVKDFCAGHTVPLPFQVSLNSTDLFSASFIPLSPVVGQLVKSQFLYTDVTVRNALTAGVPSAQGDGVRCDEDGYSFAYYETIDPVGGRRVITTHACANHFSTCQRASCADQGTVADSRLQQVVFEIPLVPEFRTTPEDVTSRGEVGVALNGVGIYSRSLLVNGVASDFYTDDLTSIDKCGGSSTALGTYRYNILPTCLMDQMGWTNYTHSPQIGWALDGFPIYSNTGPDGFNMLPCGTEGHNTTVCLDECNGYFKELPEVDNFLYRYYMPGIKGDGECSNRIIDQNSNIVNCARGAGNDPCCIDTVFDQVVHSIGCFRGCKLNDPLCPRNGMLGTDVVAKKPSYPLKAEVVYDGSAESLSSYFGVDESAPTYYKVSRWDSVDVTTTGTTVGIGGKVSFLVSFSEGVYVQGTPSVRLFQNGKPRLLKYVENYDLTTIRFETTVDANEAGGQVVCTAASVIEVSGTNRILRRANFLPLAEVDLSLAKSCCTGASCHVRTTLDPTIPKVLRVFGSTDGFFSSPDNVYMFVEFSAPVAVVGRPVLQLAVTPVREAIFDYQEAPHVLRFMYIVSPTDSTSRLDYHTVDALKLAPQGTTPASFDGIYKAGSFSLVAADLTLPRPGTQGSLGRAMSIVVDQTRPVITSATASPPVGTSGDDLIVYFDYSDPMLLVQSDTDDPLPASRNISDAITCSLTIVKPDGGLFQLMARTQSLVGSRLTLTVPIDASIPSGTVFFASLVPLIFNDCRLISAVSAIEGQLTITQSHLVIPLLQIDNNQPVVVQVYSTTDVDEFPVGAGDLVDIYVEMSLGVAVIELPTLEIKFTDGSTRLISFVSNDTQGVVHAVDSNPPPADQGFDRLHFQYVVLDGDAAYPLEYLSRQSLRGDIRRSSNKAPDILAVKTLPVMYAPGSLAYCCNVRVDTTRPFVQSLIPLKRAGLYGRNDTIVVMARFNKPVIVAGGTPTLELKVRDSTLTGVAFDNASYIERWDVHDIPIPIKATDVLFKYVVKRPDNIKSLHHSKINAIALNGATIKQLTLTPTTRARITLKDPEDKINTNGKMIQQWKFRYPHKVEFLIRDMFHTEPPKLKVTLEHSGAFSNVFEECCETLTFGQGYAGARKGNNVTSFEADTGIGNDLMFSDTRSKNLALRGVATQSKTLAGAAHKAIDNNVDPLMGHLSVSETPVSMEPWWQVQLPTASEVSTINIWPRKPEEWVTPVVKLTIRSLNGYPNGFFSLKMTNIDVYEPERSVQTNQIPFGVNAPQLAAAIKAIQGMGDASIDFKVMDLCSESGCGVGVDRGFGYVYVIDFLNIETDRPLLEVVDVQFAGGPVENAGPEKYNARTFEVLTSATVLRAGIALEVPEVPIYPGEANDQGGYDTQDISLLEGIYENTWLTPFYVMLFNESQAPPPSGLQESRDTAIYTELVTEFKGAMISLSLPRPVSAAFVKIQRVGEGSLSMAEVEVFAEPPETLSLYNKGSPVNPSPLTRPYQTEVPMGHLFNEMEWDGRWVLEITQVATESRKTEVGSSGAYGTVSDWVLIITDLAGIVHTYYQDLTAELLSLPKFGELFLTDPSTPSPYGDWREAFEVGVGARLYAKPQGERLLGFCMGVDTTGLNGVRSPIDHYRYCKDNFGVGPNLNSRTWGDTPSHTLLRNERVVVYRPLYRYMGPDFFTYQVRDGLSLQRHVVEGGLQGALNEVTMHVRNCRIFKRQMDKGIQPDMHPLCVCNQTETAIIDAPGGSCQPVVDMMCANNRTRYTFLNMCQACAGTGANTIDCTAETIRAVTMVNQRGFCSRKPAMDCSQEIITPAGREASNFLSLDAYFPPSSFSRLGTSVGGFNLYGSAPLN